MRRPAFAALFRFQFRRPDHVPKVRSGRACPPPAPRGAGKIVPGPHQTLVNTSQDSTRNEKVLALNAMGSSHESEQMLNI